MLHAWWCGGPFVVPVCDLILTFALILYISIEWFGGIFQITGVARIPAVILPTWTPPANALGSLWLPVVFCTAFLMVVLYIARMLVQVKHARNPLQPGVKHFVFGFTLLLVLGFAGLCGLLAMDVLNAIQVFGVGVTCAPLAGVVNPACLEAKTYFAGRYLHSVVLLTLLTLVGSFGIFGEIIIVWSVLRICIFGSQLHMCNGLRVPGCASPCMVAGGTLHDVSPRFLEHGGCAGGRQRDYCVPGGRSHAAKLALASGHLPPAAAALMDSDDPNACIYRGAGSASSAHHTSRTVNHTKYSNPSHASCPLDADTQQRLGIENPVANTCKISINTGRQEKTRGNPRVTRVVVNSSSSSSPSDEECRKRRRLRKPLARSNRRRRSRTVRRYPCRRSSSSENAAPRAGARRPVSRVPSSTRTGTRHATYNRCQHPPGPSNTSQPSCTTRCCSATSVCKHGHSHPRKHHTSRDHAQVRHSSRCRRAAAATCDGHCQAHCTNASSRPGADHVASTRVPFNSLLRNSSRCHLPACPADGCAADATPVGVPANYTGRPLSPCRREHPQYPAAVGPPRVSLPTRRPPMPAQVRQRSAPVGYESACFRSHTFCPHVCSARQLTRGGPSNCSKLHHAHSYQGPALIRDHRYCEMQRYGDILYRQPASRRRYPSAPPFISHGPTLLPRERLNRPLRWHTSLEQGLSHADAHRNWSRGKPWMSATCNSFYHLRVTAAQQQLLRGVGAGPLGLPLRETPPTGVFLARL